jgi:hypothetical protein
VGEALGSPSSSALSPQSSFGCGLLPHSVDPKGYVHTPCKHSLELIQVARPRDLSCSITSICPSVSSQTTQIAQTVGSVQSMLSRMHQFRLSKHLFSDGVHLHPLSITAHCPGQQLDHHHCHHSITIHCHQPQPQHWTQDAHTPTSQKRHQVSVTVAQHQPMPYVGADWQISTCMCCSAGGNVGVPYYQLSPLHLCPVLQGIALSYVGGATTLSLSSDSAVLSQKR